MRYDIYFASSAKSPRRQKGTAVYLIQAYSESLRKWQKMFRIRFEHENGNSSELLALSRALEYVSKAAEFDHATEIRICSGHGYVRSGYYWLKKWKMNGWKNEKGKTISHIDIWKAVDRDTEGKIVNIVSPDPPVIQRIEEQTKA